MNIIEVDIMLKTMSRLRTKNLRVSHSVLHLFGFEWSKLVNSCLVLRNDPCDIIEVDIMLTAELQGPRMKNLRVSHSVLHLFGLVWSKLVSLC